MAYLIAGFIVSLLLTLQMRMVAEKRAGVAAAITFVGTVVSLFVIVGIVNQASNMGGVLYAVGMSVGSYLAVKYKNGE